MPAHRPVHHREKRVHGHETKKPDALPEDYKWAAVHVDEKKSGEWMYMLMRIVAASVFFVLLLQPLYAMLMKVLERPSIEEALSGVTRLLPGPLTNHTLEVVLITIGIVLFVMFMSSRFVALLFFLAILFVTPIIGTVQFMEHGVFTSPDLQAPTFISFGLLTLAVVARSFRARIVSVLSIFAAIVAVSVSITVGSDAQAQRSTLIYDTAAIIVGMEQEASTASDYEASAPIKEANALSSYGEGFLTGASTKNATADMTCSGGSLYEYPCVEQENGNSEGQPSGEGSDRM